MKGNGSQDFSFHIKVPAIVKMTKQQFEKFKIILRDGIETFKRDFDFKKTIAITIRQGKINVVIDIPKDSSANLSLYIDGISARTIKDTIIPGIKKFCKYEKVDEGKYKIWVHPTKAYFVR